MADGSQKPISSIQVGDEVLVTDLETGQQSGQRVDAVWVHLDSLYELTTTAEVLRTTEDHPFWSVTDCRFERTDELRRGEQVVSSSGTPVDVVTFDRRAVAVAPAYNLAVADIHTYHVGIESIVFHNSCGDDVELVGFVDSAPAIVPHGTQGPVPTRAAGSTVCEGGGSGGHGLHERVASVRIMDATNHHPARVDYHNGGGQKVYPTTGRTISNADSAAQLW